MDKMSLFSILTVSVPEAILNIYVGFVLTGQRNKLYLDDATNIMRLLIATSLMVISAVTVRATIPNLLLILLLNILFYSLVLKLVYRTSWTISFLSVIIFMGVLITIESTYLLQFLVIINKPLNTYLSNDLLRFISVIPERIIQLIIIISLWKWDLVYLNLRNNKKLLAFIVILGILLVFTEGIFSYSFISYFNAFSFSFKLAGTIGCFMFALINYLICHIIIVLTKKNI